MKGTKPIILIILASIPFISLPCLAQNKGQKTVCVKIHGSDTLSDLFKQTVQLKVLQFIEKGYLECQSGNINLSKNKIQVELIKGPRYRISEFVLTNALSDTLEQESYNTAKPFTAKRYNTILSQTLGDYTNAGYPNAVLLNKTHYENQEISVNLSILPGDFYRFDSLSIEPVGICHPNYIRALTGIVPSKPYNQNLINESAQLINQTGFMRCDSVKTIFNNENMASVKWQLSPIAVNQFDGFIGVQQNNQQSTTITGQVNLQLLNTLKHGESVLLEWQKLSAESQFLNLQLSWPYIVSWPLGLSGGISIDRMDTTYTNADYKIGTLINWHKNHVCGLYYAHYGSTFSSDTNTSSTSAQYTEIEAKRLNYNLLNTIESGYTYRVLVGVGIRKMEASDSITQKDNALRFESKALLQYNLNKTAFCFQINGGNIHTPKLLHSELFKIGGINSFRGVDDRSIYCKRYLYFNNEYKMAYNKHSFALLFVDLGWFTSINDLKNETDFISSFGVGTQFYTKAGLIKINYALPSKNGASLNISNAKIHIGYSLAF